MADDMDAWSSFKTYHILYRPEPYQYEDSTDSDAEVDIENCSSDEVVSGADSFMNIKNDCCENLVSKERENVCARSKIGQASKECDKQFSICDITEDGNIADKEETRVPAVTKCSAQMNPEIALQRQNTSEITVREQKIFENVKGIDNSVLGKLHTSLNRDENCSNVVDVNAVCNKSKSKLMVENTENYDEFDSQVIKDGTATSNNGKQENTLRTTRKTHVRTDISDKDSSSDDTQVYEIESKSRKCPLKSCGKVFGRQSRLAQHLRTHTGERPYECPVESCSKSYTRQQHLKRHLEVHHTEKSKEPKKLECDECGRHFLNVYNLRRHHRRYHVQRRFTCDQCGKDFRKQQHLKTHSFTHTGIKPYTCEYPGCEMRFETPSRLKSHCLKHEGSRYACPQDKCSQTFDHYKELRLHLSISHPKVCDICSRTFRQLRQLKKHRLTHEDMVEVYFCPIVACDRYYKQANNLRTHIREKHEELQIYECGVCSRRLSTKQKLIHHMTLHEPNYKRNYASKNPRKPRKDKGTIRRDLARFLSGYCSSDEDHNFKMDNKGKSCSGAADTVFNNGKGNGSQSTRCNKSDIRVDNHGESCSGDADRTFNSGTGNGSPSICCKKGDDDDDDDSGDSVIRVNDHGDFSTGTSKGIRGENINHSKDGCDRLDDDTDVNGTLHQRKGILTFQDDGLDLGEESDDSEKSECSGDSGYVNGGDGMKRRTLSSFDDVEDMEIEMGIGSQC